MAEKLPTVIVLPLGQRDGAEQVLYVVRENIVADGEPYILDLEAMKKDPLAAIGPEQAYAAVGFNCCLAAVAEGAR